MGNAGSNARERHKSCDLDLLSPNRDNHSVAFVFDKTDGSTYPDQGNEDDESCSKVHLVSETIDDLIMLIVGKTARIIRRLSSRRIRDVLYEVESVKSVVGRVGLAL